MLTVRRRRAELDELSACPCCDGPVQPAVRRRTRTFEDLPADARVKAVEYSIPSHWCPACKKRVEPRVSAAMPKCAIGSNLAAMTCVFHYGLGLTIGQTRDVLLSPLRTRVSAGGLADIWRRMAEVLLPWHEQIGAQARPMGALAEAEYVDADTSRLTSRLRRHRDESFTFLDRPEADWNNNLAERMIRPAVILRKSSQCNRSQRGAATQTVLGATAELDR